MKPNPKFLKQPKSFWATVRTLSEKIGYSRKNKIIVPTPEDMAAAFKKLNLDPEILVADGKETDLAKCLQSYFQYRAACLTNHIEPRLMDAERAKKNIH